MSITAIPGSARFLLRFGVADAPGLAIDTPVLAGERIESVFPIAQPLPQVGSFALHHDGAWLLGHARIDGVRTRLEDATRGLYRELLGLAENHALVRVWNYVPGINALAVDGLEHYRAFCRGRSHAFEDRFGPVFPRHAPAASAVGCEGDALVIAFAAHAGAASHVENPRQLPAYDYPPEHGPRAPTFARASVVDLGEGRRAVFISGTSAIEGHASIAPGETQPQLVSTLQNLGAISRACDLGPDFAADRDIVRHFKVYLRRAEDLPVVQARLESTLLRESDVVSYLRADICRRELNIEIEATLPLVPPT